MHPSLAWGIVIALTIQSHLFLDLKRPEKESNSTIKHHSMIICHQSKKLHAIIFSKLHPNLSQQGVARSRHLTNHLWCRLLWMRPDRMKVDLNDLYLFQASAVYPINGVSLMALPGAISNQLIRFCDSYESTSLPTLDFRLLTIALLLGWDGQQLKCVDIRRDELERKVHVWRDWDTKTRRNI